MNPVGVTIGIDVSKDSLEVATSLNEKPHTQAHTPAEIRRLVLRCVRLEPQRIVLEATGGLERPLARALLEAGLPVVVANPRRIRQFARGLGVLAKTDAVDARILVLYGQKAEPRVRLPLTPEAQRRADWASRRRQLVTMLVAEKNRRTTASAKIRSQIDRMIRTLAREIAKIDEELDQALAQDPVSRRRSEILRSAPSVGPGIARTLLIDLPEIGCLDDKQIAALVGLAPFNRDSGRFKGKRKITGGRAPVRSALFLGAMNAARYHPTLRPYYERLLAAGKPRKVALTAVARKLLVSLNAMLRKDVPWQPSTP